MSASISVKTPLGIFRGKTSDGMVQYLGVNYAALKDQLAPPNLIATYDPDAIIDATKYGPRAPAPDGCALEQSLLIQCTIGVPDPAPRMSGTECLNLNITVPHIALQDNRKLPVMVWIHGGGFLMGANYWPQYDPSRLVRMAAKLGMPVIVVLMNYRLGALGNLTSEELRDVGYPGNNSLRDQKCALQWVKRYIGAFGGDAENVTVFGESAGAASVLYQLHSNESLFDRAISMSGTPVMLKPLPTTMAEMSYASILENFGLEKATASERIEKLKTASPEEIVGKAPLSVPLLPLLEDALVSKLSVPHLPHQDNLVVPVRTTFASLAASDESIPGFKWCESLMIDSTHHDGSIFLFMGLAQRNAGIAAALVKSLRNNLPADAATVVLDAYGITPATEDDEAMQRTINLATDIAYAAPTLTYARPFSGKSYLFNFDDLNSWDGPVKGMSTHMLDAAHLFQNFNEHLSEGAQKVAEALGADFVRFANGIEPWVEYIKAEGEVRVYGPSEERVVGIVGENGWGQSRRDTLWRLEESGKVDLDALSVAWDMFVAGR
ncbi:alpha/beta-hydrolase [Setomelanomma holmii]|uniref:Carboxylic ester hydrolase n=1 Tax=Setomelanomma holmii TaxID=210430 RepID=A0A9P4HFX3_9PLEO|nr:alpha/beta-hydrolase [Setomelanomma holmii]